jgi:hypothetical protein
MSIKWRISIGLLVVVLVVVFSVLKMQQYHIRENHGFELYWNSTEAYLFVRQTRFGVDLSPVEVIKGYIREYLLGSPIPVTRGRQSLTVVWFTKDAVDTQTFEDIRAERFRIVNGALFLDSQRKWKGARLEPVTPEEQQLWGSTPRSPVPEYTDFKGWSYRCCMSLPPDTKLSSVPLALAGQPVEFVLRDIPDEGVQILLKRASDLTPVVTLNDKSRRVSKEEYGQLMGIDKN